MDRKDAGARQRNRTASGNLTIDRAIRRRSHRRSSFLDRDGEEITDTNHFTIEEAMDQATFEYAIPRTAWTRI